MSPTAENTPAVFVNAADYDATVSDAVQVQLPIARQLQPTVVTVVIGAQEELNGDPDAQFTAGLTQLLQGLRAIGKPQVLLGSALALPSLAPDVRVARQASYDAVFKQVAAATGAKVVPLGTIQGGGRQRISRSGRPDPVFPIDDPGSVAFAAAFAAAYRGG